MFFGSLNFYQRETEVVFKMKILSIGNSFSADATSYLHQIAKSAKVEIFTANLFIGGCSLERHYNNILSNERAYELGINGVYNGEMVNILDTLTSNNWNYVTFQQYSFFSTDYSTYQPYLAELSSYVRNHVPGAEQIIHQTWAYEDGSEKLKETIYASHHDMFNALDSAYKQAAQSLNYRIIPSGKAFNSLREKGIDGLYRDSFHASIPRGRYILGLVWYEFFTGKKAADTTFIPDGMTEEEKDYLKNYIW